MRLPPLLRALNSLSYVTYAACSSPTASARVFVPMLNLISFLEE
jgi:hypothetical protein